MKQIHLSWLLMAAAVITACEKERIEAEPIVEPAIENATESAPYVYSVKASISSEEGTRTDYDASGKFSWTAGDAISVLFNNGETNKFFTLTTEAGGETATFSGTIDAGYEIGALDGTAEDAKIWALYPASENHSYANGAPSFYVQPEVDFTETGFSANIPMYELLTEEGAFSFKNLASTYKFTVKGIKDGIDKVTLSIHNQTTFGLSGSWPIYSDGGKIIINYGYASPGSAKSTLTYVGNVTNNQAVFYVSCHGTYGEFQPTISVINTSTGITIKTFEASKAIIPNTRDIIQPISLNVSDGDYFIPAIIINGDFSDWDDIQGVSNGSYGMFKATSDEENLYFYSWRTTSGRFSAIWGGEGYIYLGFNLDGNDTNGVSLNGYGPYDFIGFFYPYGGSSDAPTIIEAPKGTCSPEGYSLGNIKCKGVINENGAFIEYRIPRADLPTIPNESITITSWGNKDLSTVTLPCTL